MRALVLGGAALMLASGAQAGNGDELACMQQSYTATQSGELDRLLPQVDILGNDESPAMDALGTIVGETVGACASKFDWSELEFETAILFEIGRLLETGMRRHGPLAAADVTKVDAILARGDRSALWSAVERQLAAGMEGAETQMSDTDTMAFGAFMLEVGVGLDIAKAEQVGAFLAAQAMQRASRREFTSDQ